MTRLVKNLVAELPKSSLPASFACEGGSYVFFVSSIIPLECDQSIINGEAIILSTGGNAAVHYGQGKFAYSTDCWALKPLKGIVDGKFLYYFLNSKTERIDTLGFEGSGLRHLRKNFVRELEVPKYTKPEQSKIAKILATVDRAIEQTEALIAKQQSIKAGMMHDLLTRGIDEHGNLRSEKTHQFKDSPLGRIPVEWDVKQLHSLLADVDPPMRSGPFGSALLKEELLDFGIPMLGIDNVFPEKFVSDFKRFVSPKKAFQLKRYLVRPRDLMITIMGTVGRCCMVPEDLGEALSSKHVWTISLDQSKYSPYVACLQINNSPWVLNHFSKDTQGGIMASIRSETLKSMSLPVPPIFEMQKIESCLKNISNILTTNIDFALKLSSLKTALMQDLLAGKVRVTPLLKD